jgi:anthranilate synthase component 1
LPDLWFGLYDHMVVFDPVQKTAIVLALADVRDKDAANLRKAFETAADRVDQLVHQLAKSHDALCIADIRTDGDVSLTVESNLTKEQFENSVRKCVEYIRAGDIFQVVISQRLQTKFDAPPFELYRTLRIVNPSPFMFYLRTPEVTLVGSSPEILVRVVDGHVTVRPLAGTRPRGRDEAEDKRLANELLADPKERAEHVMLVDLGRNDVGRVARYGSVDLSDVMVIERYSHVMHITSNVGGHLRGDFDAFDALTACLPAGTVSGAPKVRAMEIIDEIEPTRRGPYAGAVGYVDFAGNMDTCIALRTVAIHKAVAYLQVGAGIVADSVPEAEFQETMNKARGMLKAIEITLHRLN